MFWGRLSQRLPPTKLTIFTLHSLNAPHLLPIVVEDSHSESGLLWAIPAIPQVCGINERHPVHTL